MINVQKNIPLKNHTTFRVGGPAKFFAEVKSEEELLEVLQYAKDNNLEFFILGGGSNILVSDKGFNGIVIKIHNTSYIIHNTSIKCDAGVPLALAVNKSVENDLTGLEWAAGIPGTVGGAVRGNAGAFGECMRDVIKSVRTLEIYNLQFPRFDKSKTRRAISNKIQNSKIKNQNDNAKIKNFTNKECEFGYRNSIFKKNKNLVILSATIKLHLGNKKEIQNKVREIIAKKAAKQPKGMASAGSFFKNPVVANQKLREEFERDLGIKCKDDKLPAGWLIDQAGLRGKKIGGAMVSEEHANFIVNTGNATAEDVIMLVSIIKQQVRDKFGIELEEEVRYLGF